MHCQNGTTQVIPGRGGSSYKVKLAKYMDAYIAHHVLLLFTIPHCILQYLLSSIDTV